tara:strand:- start:305 stop:652 length:348 start_codon:yes stop_codon:yes gene_type:complete
MVKSAAKTGKKLQPGSILEKYDVDNDGEITDNEIQDIREIEDIERLNRRQRHQRMMAWYALVGMISYPACIMFCEWFGLTKSADLLATIAPTYFIAAAGVAGAFMGVTAWMDKKK